MQGNIKNTFFKKINDESICISRKLPESVHLSVVLLLHFSLTSQCTFYFFVNLPCQEESVWFTLMCRIHGRIRYEQNKFD